MYNIGTFSRVTGLTIKALRLYHERGILVPRFVDEKSGYRYYNRDDAARARVVVALKAMDCSLSEIRHVMAHCADESDLVGFLHNKRETLQAEIARLHDISSVIDRIINREREVIKMQGKTFEVEVKCVEPRLVVAHRWTGAWQEIGEVVLKLRGAAELAISGPVINLCYNDEYKEFDADIEVCMPLSQPVESPWACRTLEGGEFATLLHRGPFETLGESYLRVFDWIDASGRKAGLPTRQVVHKGPGPLLEGDPDNYLTEVQVPLI